MAQKAGTLLDLARDAAARGEWPRAYALYVKADRRHGLAAPELAGLAESAYATGHLDATIDAWERAHADALQKGDRPLAAAAATRVALHLMFDTALMAPVRGWAARAGRLLEGNAETPVHAWLAVVHSYERLLSGDLAEAERWARRATEAGEGREPAAAALGRIAEARSLILSGRVSRGLDQLHDAAVAAVSGELDAVSAGVVYCEVVCGLQALAQYDLAEQWTQAMERWRQGRPVGSIHGRCRVHRAEILRLRGAFAEAEREAQLACDELRPYLRRELGWPLGELGRIRLRRGNLAGAEAAFEAADRAGWDPQPGLALVRLAQGRREDAGLMIQEALDHPQPIPSKEWPPNTDLRRAPLLDAQVTISLAIGDITRASVAVDELVTVARKYESRALTAGAVLAHGELGLATGNASEAARHFGEALDAWRDIRAPYESALARLGLGRAWKALGRTDAGRRELEAANATLDEIGAARPSHSGPAPRASAAGAAGRPPATLRRTGDYWSVEFEHQVVQVRDMKGLAYLARMLTRPGEETHVLELVASASPPTGDARSPAPSVRSLGDAGPCLDARAKQLYRRRLTEIDDDLAEARTLGDADRAGQAQLERDFLARELARAVGLGGRDRRSASASERARASVTQAVRRAIAHLRAHHPDLAVHLDRTTRTGAYCAYLPDPQVPVTWKT